MGGGLRIARILGIPIRIHFSWLIVFLLFTLLLADHPRLADRGRLETLWTAAATNLLFFGSLLLHELGHSAMAIRHRVPVRSITLFVFGGVAVMEREPETPRIEFEIAVAGPLVSALLALVFTLAERAAPADGSVAFAAGWLATGNFLVAGFNLLPGLPLDGGRMLRAFLWARSGNAGEAAVRAGRLGQALGYGFIGLGAASAVTGAPFGGLWLLLVGGFLALLAGVAVQQASWSRLEGLSARDAMGPEPSRVGADESVANFTRRQAMRGRRWALVEEAGGAVVGLVTLTDVRRLDPDRWEATAIRAVATPLSGLVVARPETPLRDVAMAMGARRVGQIPVVEGDRVVGAVTRETLGRLLGASAGAP